MRKVKQFSFHLNGIIQYRDDRHLSVSCSLQYPVAMSLSHSAPGDTIILELYFIDGIHSFGSVLKGTRLFNPFLFKVWEHLFQITLNISFDRNVVLFFVNTLGEIELFHFLKMNLIFMFLFQIFVIKNIVFR